MANIKSSLKRASKAKELTVRNASLKTGFRTAIRNFRTLLQQDPTEAEKALPAVGAALDQAAGKGVIHRNTAARRKSRLAGELRRRKEEWAAAETAKE